MQGQRGVFFMFVDLVDNQKTDTADDNQGGNNQVYDPIAGKSSQAIKVSKKVKSGIIKSGNGME